MGANLEPLPGTADIWEPEISEWIILEQQAREVFRCYGYQEVRTPVFERTEVFVHGLGNDTDVVQKEMYTFDDRGGRSLTLRPEGTAGVMRAIANHGLAEGEEQRVFYLGPMFRGERPAAGRRRQFHQVGVEAVGRCSAAQDAECMAMLLHYLKAVGIHDGQLLLNSRGTAADRPAVSAALRDYFSSRIAGMCEDCRRRWETNVWRILDCKMEPCQEPILNAPRVIDLLGAESQALFQEVCNHLGRLGIPYRIEPRLVRGLDYYVHTVFEVIHGGLGAQNALAGGGRYQITLPGTDRPVHGVGFAAGMERLLLARQSLGLSAAPAAPVQVYIAALGPEAMQQSLILAARLRHRGIRVLAETGSRSMKAQLRTANKVGAVVALIQGETELSKGIVLAKNMKDATQAEWLLDQVPEKLAALLGCTL